MNAINLFVAIALVGMVGMVGFVSAEAGDVVDTSAFGVVQFSILAGAPADATVFVMNDKQGIEFDARFNADGTPVAGQDNSKFRVVTVLPDGKSVPEVFTNGEFTAFLRQGNGDQMETKHFTVAGADGQPQVVTFQGAARPSDERITGFPIVVLGAYGFSASHQEKVVDCPAHDVTVIDLPATEDRFVQVRHNMGTFDFVAAVPGTPAVPAVAEHYAFVGFFHGDFIFVPGHPAIKKVVHVPEKSHMVTVVDGTVVDVTAQVKEAVSQGHFQFKFNNAMNPGGIVNPEETAVYVQINDPAFGFVKDVKITYTGRFEPSVRTIEVHEHDLVDLGA